MSESVHVYAILRVVGFQPEIIMFQVRLQPEGPALRLGQSQQRSGAALPVPVLLAGELLAQLRVLARP
jgi:hypothetical protein